MPTIPSRRVPSLALPLALLAGLVVLGMLLVASQHTRPAQAQGTISLAISKTLDNPSNVVRVGQVLTFSIRIENTGSVTVSELPLLDQFDAEILRFISADPAPSIEASDNLTWTNLVDSFGLIGPGRVIVVTTLFRAIRAEERTVNRAELGAAIGESGETGGGESDDDAGPPAEGGNLPVTKTVAGVGTVQVGQLLTFTMAIRNDGAADVVSLPFEDRYDTSALLFVDASPFPDSINVVSPTGTLRWADLLSAQPPLRPNEVITLTSVFSAVAAFDGDVNSAAAVGAADEFGNQVGSDRPAVVPIRIIDEGAAPTPSAIPTPRPADDDNESRPDPTEQSTSQPSQQATVIATSTTLATTTPAAATPASTADASAPIAQATVTATPTVGVPASLPNTSRSAPNDWVLLGLIALGGLLSGLYLRRGPPQR